jgi:sigma-B regulation protein RsbU (phosphoserine phosphatase)
MTILGRISITHPLSPNEARRKIFVVVQSLTDDAIAATRVATAVSVICRLLYRDRENAQLEVALSGGDGFTSLVLHFEYQGLPCINNSPKEIFDNLSQSKAEDSHQVLVATKHLGKNILVNLGVISNLQNIVERKSRDELTAEVQIKNRELEESLENLRQTTSVKERLEGDMLVGHDIQMSMLPLVFPAFPDRTEFEVYASLEPARQVGGDLYDFFLIDDNQLCFCIGDVSGKGVPAALFMAVTKTLIKSKSTQRLSPGTVLSRVNDDLALDNKTCMFVTVFAGILDITTGEITYCNAGHNPPYIKRMNGETVRMDKRHGPVLGAMEDIEYGEDQIGLEPGDRLLMYTDGVTEAMNPSEELFGEQLLQVVLEDPKSENPEYLVHSIVQAVEKFENGAERADDITVLCVKYHGVAKTSGEMVMTLKNRLEEIDRVNEVFDQFALENGIPKDVSFKLNMVFDDLLNNVITYAYPDEKDHEIEITVQVNPGRLSVTLVDGGIPFNPFEAEEVDTTLSLEERSIGGLGIHLVKNTMDETTYNREDGKNVVRLVKYLDVKSADSN